MSDLAPAVSHAIKLIELLSDVREPIGISEISRKLNMTKNMAFRILRTLEQDGWVYCEKGSDSKYRLSLVPFQITSRVVNNMSLNTVAIPYVHELWQKTGESTHLGILKGNEVLYIQHLDSVKNLRVAGAVGGLYPLHCASPGKVLLAFAGDDYIEQYISAGLKRYTKNTITNGAALQKHLEEIRSQGFAVDNEEYSNGIACFSAPVFDYTEKVAGAVGSSFSTIYCDIVQIRKTYGELILSISREISGCLGYRE